MKRFRLAVITGLVLLVVVAAVYAGSYGYTYYIGSSTYNIWGQAIDQSITLQTDYKTWSVRVSGTAVPNGFQKLVLRGRIWKKLENFCPLFIHRNVSNHCKGCTETTILSLAHPVGDANGFFSIGRHRLKHPNAVNVNNATPIPFYTENLGSNTPSTEARFDGEGLFCSVSPNAPKDID